MEFPVPLQGYMSIGNGHPLIHSASPTNLIQYDTVTLKLSNQKNKYIVTAGGDNSDDDEAVHPAAGSIILERDDRRRRAEEVHARLKVKSEFF